MPATILRSATGGQPTRHGAPLWAYLLVAALFGTVPIALCVMDGIAPTPLRGLADVLGWMLLALLLRPKICHASKLTTLAAGVVLGAAWAILHCAVALVETLWMAAKLRQSPTPVDLAIDLVSFLQFFVAGTALGVVGSFVLRALPAASRPGPGTHERPHDSPSSRAT